MCGVVAYGRLKTLENSKTVSQKSGCVRLREVVIYNSRASIFGVLERWLLLGGGRLREVLTRGGLTVLVNYGNNDVHTIFVLFLNFQPLSSLIII